MNSSLHINEFGYSEMYEWANLPDHYRYGRFVQLCDKNPYYIELAKNDKDIIGVTTINAAVTSNMSNNYWQGKYIFDEFGDIYVKEKTIAIGSKEYDSINEMEYISTKEQKIYEQILNSNYNINQQYISREHRAEWIRVNLLGKCIVEDNGICGNSKYCKLYTGNIEKLFGTAIPANEYETCLKWRIMHRVSDKTIMIFYK